MRKLLALVLLLAVACAGSPEPPDAPLDRQQFEQVLAGSLLIQARAGQEIRVDKRPDAQIAAYYDELFRAQGITEADFQATYAAYLERPELLKEVYESVLNRLQLQADSLAHE